jgi:ribosome-binding factor A
MSIRTERVASLIKEEIGALLVRDYSDPAFGFITVTDVTLSPDLRIAKVYFSVFAKPEVQEQTMGMLEGEKGRIRGIVGSRMKIRFVPELQFFLDGTMDRVDRLNRIFKQIHKDDEGGSGPAGT